MSESPEAPPEGSPPILVTEPEIVTNNAWRLDHHAAAIVDRLAELMGPAQLGAELFPGLAAIGNPRKRSARCAGAVRRLSTALDHYGAELVSDDSGPSARRLVGALDGRGPVSVAELARSDGDYPGATVGEGISWLLDHLEEIGQSIAAPGLVFGPIPDDGSWAWYWDPSDDDILIDAEGRAWYGRTEIPGGAYGIADWMDAEQHWPMVWREDTAGGVEPVEIDAYLPRTVPTDLDGARVVLADHHGGQSSPIYAFVSSGAIRADLLAEIDFLVSEYERDWQRPDLAESLEPMADLPALRESREMIAAVLGDPRRCRVDQLHRAGETPFIPYAPAAVDDSEGMAENWWAVWVETSHQPAVYVVAADDAETALDVFTEHYGEREGIMVEDFEIGDYAGREDELYYNDGGTGPFDIESVQVACVTIRAAW